MRSIVYHQFRKELHIIKTQFCISSTVLTVVYHHCERGFWYTPEGVMRYKGGNAALDDMPLLSQWIKKSTCFHKSIFWRSRRDSFPSCGSQNLLFAWSANKFWPLRHFTLTVSATGGVRAQSPHLRCSSSSNYTNNKSTAFAMLLWRSRRDSNSRTGV